MLPSNPQRIFLAAALGYCALVASGCVGLGLPRIDPSGERVFIWPRNQVPAVAPASANLQAPPVFTDPVFPQPILPGNPALGPQPLAGLLPPLPQDRLSITPDRVLAPVGSEVILKAGLCTRDNFLLTDSKIDWLLARDGAGEFVSLGGRGWCKDAWLPWNKSKKIDNQYGIGYTAKVPLLITRGTADPSDDLQIEPGEAWASVTSQVEGTSRITAVAPEIETWANRRAAATIYWVDVQWTFPPTVVTAGGSQVLTTIVRRQTDGTPIEGWLVRYEVAHGGAALRGSETGQVVEVPTDVQGRASIDVTPTGSSGTTTQINTQIVRPQRFAGSDAPRLVIASGASRVNWTDGGSDYLPPPDDLDGPTPAYPIPGQGSTPQLPRPPAARRGPVLDLEVHEANETEVVVGGPARFEVVVRNVGDSTATGVVLRDVFDQGLTHLNDPQGLHEIQKTDIGDLTPGESRSLFIQFQVVAAGRLRQVFTATSNEGASIEKQAFIDVPQPIQQPQGELEVSKLAPRLQSVGELALFTLSIKNVGDAPLTNIEVVDSYDPELQPTPAPGAVLRNGSLFWKIPRLEAGQNWRQEVSCECMAPKVNACGTVSVSADTGTGAPALSTAKVACLEIQPGSDVVPPVVPNPRGDVVPGGAAPPAGAGSAPGGPNAASALRMEILLYNNPVRAGALARFQISIGNNAPRSEQQVQLRVLLPQELTPDKAAIQTTAGVQAQFKDREWVFAPIAELRPEEKLTFDFTCTTTQPGVRNITANLSSQNVPQGIEKSQRIDIVGGQ